MRLGIFGGTFDPIHTGHLMAAEAARQELGLDQVLFIPAKAPPHKQGCALAPAEHRLRMVSLAIEGNPHFRVTDMELRRAGTSYTILTLRDLRETLGQNNEFFFVIGSDTISELPTWKEIGRLAELTHFVAIRRPGERIAVTPVLTQALGEAAARALVEQALRVPVVDVSSTDIRRRTASGRSVRYLVPETVRVYIQGNGLYSDLAEETKHACKP